MRKNAEWRAEGRQEWEKEGRRAEGRGFVELQEIEMQMARCSVKPSYLFPPSSQSPVSNLTPFTLPFTFLSFPFPPPCPLFFHLDSQRVLVLKLPPVSHPCGCCVHPCLPSVPPGSKLHVWRFSAAEERGTPTEAHKSLL